MKRVVAAILAASLLLPTTVRADADSAIQHYIAGMRAREAGDFATYAASMRAALGEVPGHAVLLRHVAQAHALAGEEEAMIEALAEIAPTGAYFDLEAMEEFDAFRGGPAFVDVRDGIAANAEPEGDAVVVATVEHPLLVPEGTAWDPHSRSLFLSSLRERKIVRVDEEGHTTDFASGHEEYFAGLGLKVDGERGLLWGVSASFAGMLGHDESNDGWSSLCAFDLTTGELRRAIVVPAENEQRHNFNDLAVAPDGTVYLTDAMSGALHSLASGADSLETFLPVGTLSGPNGIAIDAAGSKLYVAQYNLDVVCVDLATRELRPLRRDADAAIFGVDGLYWREGELIAVQNHPALDRVARFRLGSDGESVEAVEVLARRLPGFEEPTTGAIVGDAFVFIANSQIATYDALEPPVEAAQLDPVVLMRVELGAVAH